MKRVFVAIVVAVVGAALTHVLLEAQAPLPQATGLSFFKNYFVTGNYVVGGVNLRGTGEDGVATGIIDLTTLTNDDIPDGADVVAAFLYWQTVETPNSGTGADGATFQGNLNPSAPFDPLGRNDISGIAKVLNPTGTAPCWSSGGGTGGADGAHQMYARRADVLRFIPYDPVTERYIVKTRYEVRLLDAGTGNQVPSTPGASLVVVFKDPSQPLRSVVIYNGGYTMDNSTQRMNRTLQGFYQAGVSPGITSISAKITHIVGEGSEKPEQLFFDSGNSATTPLGSNNPFQGLTAAAGTSTDPAWDNLTLPVTVTAGASAVTTRVDHVGSPFDCLSWGAIIFSTTVQDTDNDALLDVWESPQTTPLVDPNGVALPNLNAMGAQFNRKDVFVDVSAMTTAGYSNPTQGAVTAHNHLPTQAALDMVGDAFKNAPVDPIPSTNPQQYKGIAIHFDVGNRYQTKPGSNPPVPDPYIVPANLSRGGEQIVETACVQTSTQDCLFESYPGTVGWKRGFAALSYEPLNFRQTDPTFTGRSFSAAVTNGSAVVTSSGLFLSSDFGRQLRVGSGPIYTISSFTSTNSVVLDRPYTEASGSSIVTVSAIRGDYAGCAASELQWAQFRTGATSTQPTVPECLRRFDRNRKDMFHFLVSVHAIGSPRLDANGDPILDSTGSQIPRNVSGTADGGGWGGGDLMLALGFWDDFVGTDFAQGSTLMHELGHNFRFRHGGPTVLADPVTNAPKIEPNCKPNYQTVMSYLFQMSGLLCDPLSPSPQCAGKAPGEPVIDYSRQTLSGAPGLSEHSLTEQSPAALAGMIYRTRWYSPTSTLDQNQNSEAASRHCDGTRLNTAMGEVGEFRIDGTSLTAVDWNGNLTIDPGTNTAGQDINANGGPNTVLASSTDGAFSGSNDWASIDLRQIGSRRNITTNGGLLSIDQGQNDNGQNDNGQNDNGQNDNGQNDNGQNDNGQNDNGQNDNGVPLGEADLDLVRSLGNPPTLLKPTVVKQTVLLNWRRPHADTNFVTYYWVYRVTGAVVNQATLLTRVLVSANPVPAGITTLTDLDTKNNVTYTYWVQAQRTINNGGQPCAGTCLSGVSNFQVVAR